VGFHPSFAKISLLGRAPSRRDRRYQERWQVAAWIGIDRKTETVSAKFTPEENFTKLIELHKTKGPVPFGPTQRDYKRQEKLVSVDSLSKITFDDGLFKDEADLNGFVRWILRCQAKREAGTLEP
jgi:proteasome lid subunit RPN8/RPN11